MNEELFIKRSVYRELFNDICADFSIYRLHNNTDEEFEKIEKSLWSCREKSIRMDYSDKPVFDDLLIKAQAFLVRKELFAT